MSKRQRGQFAAATIQFPGKVSVLEWVVGVGEARSLQADDPTPQVPRFRAIWDTGATHTAISSKVISDLHLPNILPPVKVSTANGIRDADVYLVNLYLDNVRVTGLRVTDTAPPDTDVLIGMDVVGLGDLAITHSGGRTCVSFRTPPGKKIDYVAQFNAYNS